MEARPRPAQARLIDGKAAAALVRERVRAEVLRLRERGVVPGLAVVLVGDDPASSVYVRNKDRAAREVGIDARTLRLGATTSQAELERNIAQLSQDPSVHGVLVQLPLPKGLDAERAIGALDPAKDVDGLHPSNVAKLVLGQADALVPCTPAGCLELLDQAGVALEGRHAIVIGRSMLVGKPLAFLLLARNATVTMAHSRTRDLPALCARADVVCAAVGQPELVRGAWLKPGACVLDVGINRGADGGLVGDVAFQEALSVAGAISPVPGGVGPMTIAMLLSNTARAAHGAAGGSAASSPARPGRAGEPRS